MKTVKPGQANTLIGLIRSAVPGTPSLDRFQDKQKGLLKNLSKFLRKRFGRTNPFAEDKILKQTYFFDPKGRVRPVEEQIELLEGAYLIGCKADEGYVAQRLNEPSPNEFVKVAVPKLLYLERYLRPANLPAKTAWSIAKHIGVAIQHVTGILKQRRPTFGSYRIDELQKSGVRVHKKTMNRRVTDEAVVPGDILILDVHMGNFLGDQQITHTPRFSRAELLISDTYMALSAVDGNWILVLNDDLLSRDEDLGWDYLLEEYCVGGGGWGYSFSSYFSVRLWLGRRYADRARADYAALVAVRPGVQLDI